VSPNRPLLRSRRFALALTLLSSLCSLSALPCSLVAPPCSPSATSCSRSLLPPAPSFKVTTLMVVRWAVSDFTSDIDLNDELSVTLNWVTNLHWIYSTFTTSQLAKGKARDQRSKWYEFDTNAFLFFNLHVWHKLTRYWKSKSAYWIIIKVVTLYQSFVT